MTPVQHKMLDRFAEAALPAIISNLAKSSRINFIKPGDIECKLFARLAYDVAQAMLAESTAVKLGQESPHKVAAREFFEQKTKEIMENAE